jgi:hypothetical protein
MEGLFFIAVHRTAGGTPALQLLCATSSDSPTKKARLAPGQPVRPKIPMLTCHRAKPHVLHLCVFGPRRLTGHQALEVASAVQ